MYNTARLLAGALVAMLAIAFPSSIANANTMTAEPSGAITATSIGKLTFSGRGGFEIVVECRVTLNGRVNGTIDNRAGGLLGTITEGRLNECGAFNSGLALFTSPRSWTLELGGSARLEGEIDLLSVNAIGTQWQITSFGIGCLYAGTLPLQLEASGMPTVTRSIRVLENFLLRFAGERTCPSGAEVIGSFSFTRQTLRL